MAEDDNVDVGLVCSSYEKYLFGFSVDAAASGPAALRKARIYIIIGPTI